MSGDTPTSGEGRISTLPTETVERIAAGEVITRPARVVAELVENALDADASRVTVRVDGDGTDRIVVADDGHGLSAADARRAVRPHTTSKIDAASDLAGVDTLGFRGEALASVVDAAETVHLVTNDGGGAATDLTVRGTAGDQTVTTAETSRGRGTTVTVEGLFADRPARREGLAAPETEFGRISRLVSRYALVHADVAFEVVHDGDPVQSTPGTGRTDALLAVYDRETAAAAVSCETTASVPGLDESDGVGDGDETGGVAGGEETDGVVAGDDADAVTVSGRLCSPAVTRSDRRGVHVAVNGRPVTDDGLARAVRRGYGRLLPDGREPVAVVCLTVPPTAVDPNVHPAKERVALAASEAIADVVADAVADALSTAELDRPAETAVDLETALDAVDAETDDTLATARVVGQYRDLYLLCEADEDLLVVDQHAAHERVTFERLRARVADEAVPSRAVDPPATVTLDPGVVAAVEHYADRLRQLGFAVREFGGDTVRVTAVPAPLGRAAAPESLREVAATLARGETPTPREDLLAEVACHPSLRAGETVDDETARQLLDRLSECERPYACPHGRPTVLRVDEATLARGFERENTRLG
ncbi:DNA mismatch repair endonuclease MutL [Halobaculum sp. MBLA0147]|uniref:DNA mismatch repair endonuclease MutL n=1 Tax=Halobaculum sp. MBLA0147 TaxID=3079934 RepID=UPI00352578CE